MAGVNNEPFWNDETGYLFYPNAVLLFVLVIAAMPKKRSEKMNELSPLHLVWYGFLFLLTVAYLVDATKRPY